MCDKKMENLDIAPPVELFKVELNVPVKTMMSAGPTNVSKEIREAMMKPVLGHLHPETFKIMDDIKEGIKYVFQTRNPLTVCVSASGHAGMETVLCNLLEDGEVAMIGVTGIWGHRAAEMASRYGADTRLVEASYGSVLTANAVEEAMLKHKPVIFFVVQGDSSTGLHQPLEEFGELCRKHNCLLVVDCVASLGGVEMQMDKWGIDAMYTGSQKVLGGPPGITPVSFGPRAIQKMYGRNSKCKVYYFDALLLGDYWGCFERPRIYHHTIAPTLLYGLREALSYICRTGLETSIKKHKAASLRLQKGIEELGLEMYVENPVHRLPTVNSIVVPEGVDGARIVNYLMHKHSLEIGGGLGPTAGKIWRIGLMCENATFEKVDYVLKHLREALPTLKKPDSKM